MNHQKIAQLIYNAHAALQEALELASQVDLDEVMQLARQAQEAHQEPARAHQEAPKLPPRLRPVKPEHCVKSTDSAHTGKCTYQDVIDIIAQYASQTGAEREAIATLVKHVQASLYEKGCRRILPIGVRYALHLAGCEFRRIPKMGSYTNGVVLTTLRG